MEPPVASMQLGARYPGSLSTAGGPITFIVPGLPDLHFLAWGTARGSVAVSCAQVEAGHSRPLHDPAAPTPPTPLHSVVVLDLCQPSGPSGGGSGRPLDEPVLHLAYGGGPHLLLAAATEQWLVVCSLEGLAASLFAHQVAGGPQGEGMAVGGLAAPGGPHALQAAAGELSEQPASPSAAESQHGEPEEQGEQQLYRQLAAVRCRGAPIIGLCWTQQLDGVLVSQADGTLTMWQLRQAQHQEPLTLPNVAAAKPPATQGPAAPAGAGAAAPPGQPSSTAGAAAVTLAPAWRAAAAAPQDLLSAGASVAHPTASSARGRQERGASIWWPPAAEAQQQQDCAGRVPADAAVAPVARCERLKHPCALTGLEWSPGVLQKDPLSIAGPGAGASAAQEGLEAQATELATPWDDHPALMTVGADGVIRLWVETMVVLLGQPLGAAAPGSPPAAAASSSGGSNSRSALAQQPHVESYFCMALVIEPPPAFHAGPGALAVAATWGRSPGCPLGRTPARTPRAVPPVLWLVSHTMQPGAAGTGSVRSTLRAHAVRGLQPIVMSSYMGAMSSGGSNGSACAQRPQALLWGQRSWEAAAGAARQQPGSLACWVVAEEEFPELHVMCSEAPLGAPQLRVRCWVLATVESEEATLSPGGTSIIHRHLALASSWHAELTMHAQDVVSLQPGPAAPLLASLDAAGGALLWHALPGGELHLASPLVAPSAANGSMPPQLPQHQQQQIQALAWAPAGWCRQEEGGGGYGQAGALLVAATPSQLLMYHVRPGPPAQQQQQTQQQQGQQGAPAAAMAQQWAPALLAALPLPAGMPAVHTLRALPCAGTSAGATSGRFWVAAICRGEGGSALHLQGFDAAPSPSGGAPRVGPAGAAEFACVHAFPTAVTASLVVPEPGGSGGGWLAVGLASARLQLLRLGGEGEATGAVTLAAELALGDAPAALAAAPGAAYIAVATAGDQDAVEVWRRAPVSSAGRSARQYTREAVAPLPDTPTALAWLPDLAAPALVVGCAGRGELVFAKGHHAPGAGWCCLAELAAPPAGVAHLTLAAAVASGEPRAGSGGASSGRAASVLVGAGGGELFTLAGGVAPPQGGPGRSLARWVLERAGPLPQYHPAALAALLLAGRPGAAAAVLGALLAWVRALRQHDAAQCAQQEGGTPLRAAGPSAAPKYQSVPLAQLAGSGEEAQQLAAGAAGLGAGREGGGACNGLAPPPGSGRDSAAAAPDQLRPREGGPAASALDTGMLDMGAFGLGGTAAPAEAAPRQPARPAGSALESEQLDLAAFGLGGSSQPAASPLESGQLDLAAFGLGGASQPAPPQPAASPLESGQLDLAAFGLDSTTSQPAASPLESGQLDLAAFGLDSTTSQPAASPLESGQLDLAAFGLGGTQQPALRAQPAASPLESGQLDMAAFGLGGTSQPPPPPPAAQPTSALHTGQLDLSAFGLGGFDAALPPLAQPPEPAAPSSPLESGQLDLAAFGMGPVAGGAMPAAPAHAARPPRPATPGGSSSGGGPVAAGSQQGATPLPSQAAPRCAQALPPPPQQRLVPLEQLHPLPADLARELLQELGAWQGQEAEQAQGPGGPSAAGAPGSLSAAAPFPAAPAAPAGQARAAAGPADAATIPQLTQPEAAALLALLRSCAPPEAGPTAGAGGPVDTCGAQFLTCLSLALAAPPAAADVAQDGGAEPGGGGAGGGLATARRGGSSASVARGLGGSASAVGLLAGGSGASLGGGGAGPGAGAGGTGASVGLFARPVSMKNAAGVEYTLAPASSAALLAAQAEGSGGGGRQEQSLAEGWGLLPGLDATSVLWAGLSGTQQALLSHAVEQVQRAQHASDTAKAQQALPEASFLAIRKPAADAGQQLTWEVLRGLGAGFWLADAGQAREVAERLAKAQFAASRNADDCALLYCALGKKSVLQGLYRTTQNRRLAEFLSRDFAQPAHRQAACKNAFVLLGQHRHALAAAFFILGGVPEDAVGVCAHEMHDVQLALFLCRVLWGPGSEGERRVLERDVVPVVEKLLRRQQQQQAGSGGGDVRGSTAALPGAQQGQRATTAGQLRASSMARAEEAAAGSSAADTDATTQAASSAAALCQWLLGDAVGAVLAALGASKDEAQGAESAGPAALMQHTQQGRDSMSTAEAVQLLPLLRMLLASAAHAPTPVGRRVPPERLRALLAGRCLAAADVLKCHGVHALALGPALAACKLEQQEQQQQGVQQGSGLRESVAQDRLHLTCALSLLPHVLGASVQRTKQGWRSAAQQHLAELQGLGLEVETEAVLGMLRPMVHQLAAASAGPQRIPAFLLGHGHAGSLLLQKQASTVSRLSVHSTHSASSSTSRRSQPAATGEGAGSAESEALLSEGHLLFRVDGDRGEGLASCATLLPEGVGRPLVLATRRHGLVEGEACLLLPEAAASGAEEALSPVSDAGSAQRGSLFSRLIDQLFDQTRWEGEWLDDVASEGELSTAVAGAMMAAASGGGIYTGGGRPAEGSVVTQALCAHPTRNLFLSGCASGRVHLWQFGAGSRPALTSYTPVPLADLAEARGASLLSFSTRLRGSAATSRLANWGRCAALRFSATGERFAAVGEGGVVATWRLEAPPGGRGTDSDGAACSDWWHAGLGRAGRAVEYVGGSSSLVAVGGRGHAGEGNIAVWDTLAPPSAAGVGRLGQHQVMVTALCMLPGGWLLASGDEGGALSLSDVRMMGGGKGARVLWSVRAAHGAVSSIAWAARPGGASGGGLHRRSLLAAVAGADGQSAAGIVTGGQDGVVRVWQPADGRLLQSVEPGRQGPSGGERPGSAGPAAAVTGLAACAEGVIVGAADGAVRLLPFSGSS